MIYYIDKLRFYCELEGENAMQVKAIIEPLANSVNLPERLNKFMVFSFDLVDISQIFWRRNSQEEERTVFVSSTVFDKLDTVRNFSNFFHVSNKLLVLDMPFAYLEAKILLWGRNGRVIFNILW